MIPGRNEREIPQKAVYPTCLALGSGDSRDEDFHSHSHIRDVVNHIFGCNSFTSWIEESEIQIIEQNMLAMLYF